MSSLLSIIIPVAALLVGVLLGWLIFRYVLNARYQFKLKQAELEAESVKKAKMQEVKDKFYNLKNDLDKQITQRNAKLQGAEARIKQREMQLNQRNEELLRKKGDLDIIRENLDAQMEVI